MGYAAAIRQVVSPRKGSNIMNITVNGAVYQVWNEQELKSLLFSLKLVEGAKIEQRKVS
jgi:hypothetical protein